MRSRTWPHPSWLRAVERLAKGLGVPVVELRG